MAAQGRLAFRQRQQGARHDLSPSNRHFAPPACATRPDGHGARPPGLRARRRRPRNGHRRLPSALTPPKLVTFVERGYPAAAKAARLQAHVDLELTIDATGRVTERVRRTGRQRLRRGGRRGCPQVRLRAGPPREIAPSPRASDTATSSSCRPNRLPPPRRGPGRAASSHGAQAPGHRRRGRHPGFRGRSRPRCTAITDAIRRLSLPGLAPGRFHVKLAAADRAAAGRRRGRHRGRAHVGDLPPGRQPAVERSRQRWSSARRPPSRRRRARSRSAVSAPRNCCAWPARAAIPCGPSNTCPAWALGPGETS